ncbi:N-acyl homoserine lactonase family protein [Ideonella sp. BN130291]|uniref:N-acyl homoserine lactonase family protein n=1 Tax=Ideonella sp. BN130291 TaxID=3112940 RepID=UPI002E270C9C|nr:N-acyl homoserine lactonase family protein [Ideonella sp. BN130291]
MFAQHLLTLRALACTLPLLLSLASPAVRAAAPEPPLRLYVLDCGHAEFTDFRAGSDTGELDGKPATLADPCFLVRHPKGWLLWDAGLPERLPSSVTGGVAHEDTLRRLGFRTWVERPLVPQLQALGLTPGDITHLAFSHLHFDHVGNANLFMRATWILDRRELAWALASPAHVSMDKALISGHRTARTLMIDGDHDVFGDGSVRILHAPGHTPGSSVLLLQLPKAGAVLLSGDLYLSLEGRAHRHVPAVNADRADTLASMQRVEAIAQRLQARVIVQHDPAEFDRLPKPPAWLE